MSHESVDDPLVLLPETIDISGGTVLTANAAQDTDVDRMIWLDAVAKVSGSERRVHVRLFLNTEAALRVAINVIQAAGRADGKRGAT